MNTVKSPCVKICELNYQSEICIGCFRTLDEIGQWTVYSDREKLSVLKECETRKNRQIVHG